MGSATVPIAAGIAFIAAAVVILCREVVVKVAIPCHGLTSATREGGEGGAVAELPIVEVLCHEIVGRSFDVCHVPIIGGAQAEMAIMEDTLSVVTRTQGMGALPSTFQTTISSPVYCANQTEAIRYAPLMVGV